MDFTEGQRVFPEISDTLQDLDIGVLVNNVGLSYVHPEYFVEVSNEVLMVTHPHGMSWSGAVIAFSSFSCINSSSTVIIFLKA